MHSVGGRLLVILLTFAIVLGMALPGGLRGGGYDAVLAQAPPPTPVIPTPVIPTPGGPPSLPAIPKGIGVDIPDVARQAASDAEFIDVFCSTARWQVQQLFDLMDVWGGAFGSLQAATTKAGIQITVPDIAGPKAEASDKLDVLCAASTVEQAQDRLNDLLGFGNSVQQTFLGMGQQIEAAMTAFVATLAADVQGQITSFVTQETASLQGEIEGAVQGLIAATIGALGEDGPPGAMQTSVTAQVNSLVAQKTADLTSRIQQRVNGIVAEQIGPLKDIEKILTDAGVQSEQASNPGSVRSAELKQIALTKRKDLMSKVIAVNIAGARVKLEAYRKDLDAAKLLDPTTKSADEILAEITADAQDFDREMHAIFFYRTPLQNTAGPVGADARLKRASDAFVAKWDALAKEASSKKLSWQTLRDQAAPQLATASQQFQAASGVIAGLQSQATGKTDAQSLAINAIAADLNALKTKIAALVARVDPAVATLNSPPAGDVPQSFLDLLDSLKADGDTLASEVAGVKQKALHRESVLIQAEDELSASVAKTGTPWDSRQEDRNPGRVGWTGDGDWVLYRGGDSLSYSFATRNAATFYVWVRDLTDRHHPVGARKFTVTVDGKVLGTFNENSQPNTTMVWHQLTSGAPISIALSPGTHTLVIAKPSPTTSAAAILDAYYFSTDPNDTPPIAPQNAPKVVKPQAITIQAEDEISAQVQKPGTSWDSTEERTPSWRKGWTGGGDWYLSRSGDKLTYRFTTETEADFFLWIRDWADGRHPANSRVLNVTIDGWSVSIGDPTVQDSQHHWRRVASPVPLKLAAGTHTMTVTKAATTSSAAIVDAFFLTDNEKVTP